MLLNIAQLGQPILRQVATEVPAEVIPTEEFQQFLRDMAETLAAAGGVGLAAPQVFVSKRVFLAGVLPPAEPEGMPGIEVMINPVLTFTTEERGLAWEGCLSFMELLVKVPRYRALTVRYLSSAGEPRELELKGFPARVVQHENDHLDGILTIDRPRSTKYIVKTSEIEAVLEDEERRKQG